MPNQFLTFAADAAADVMPWNDYAANTFTTRLLGFSTGTALSTELNRVWRQSSMISSMIGEFAFDRTGRDMLDDGTPAGMTTLQLNFDDAVKMAALEAIGTGYLPITGGTLTGPLTIAAPSLSVNAPTGQWSSAVFTRGAGFGAQLVAGTPANLWRWTVALADSAPETGGNAGSNFSISRFNDAGAYLDAPILIDRATGVVNFAHPPTFAGGPLPYLPLTGGTVTGPVGIIGNGIIYNSFGGNYHAFAWDGPNAALNAFVDGTYIGTLATRNWVNANHGGAYLPLAGGTITGNLVVQGHQWGNSASFASSVAFANDGNFVNYASGNYRARQWASSWSDLWDGTNGNRIWITPGSAYMLMTSNADLYVTGAIRSHGGRIVSTLPAGISPSMTLWNQGGAAMGMWCDPTALVFGEMDGSGNAIKSHMVLETNGAISIGNSLYAVSSIVSAASIHANQDLSATETMFSRNAWIDNAAWAQFFLASNRVHADQLVSSGGNVDAAVDLVSRRDTYTASISYAWKHLSSGGTTPLLSFDSLAAICAADGFDAAALQDLPDAVTMAPSQEGADPTGLLDPVALIAHLFRAVKQLNDKLEGK